MMSPGRRPCLASLLPGSTSESNTPRTLSARDFAGINGRTGNGGALGNGGPVVAGDHVYVNSGFNILNVGLPGNVLLAYRLPGVRPSRAQ